MQDLPEDGDLLSAVADFLEHEVRPRLHGDLAFHTRVAVNVVEQVRRNQERAPALGEEENERLASLLDESGDTATLTHDLCRRIAAGDITLETPGLNELLWFITLNKLAVHQPRYVTYRRIMEGYDANWGG
jgi:hypothetical protein